MRGELDDGNLSRPTVFIVGAPRSGTTLLQNLLGAHPLVATSQETDLFDQYVNTLRGLWEWQLPPNAEEWKRRRHKGLPAILTEEEFEAILAGLIERVHAATMALKPRAQVLLEKVPGYSLHGDLILRYVPHARFIHLVRDGRDVATSTLRASRGWGRRWAPDTAEAASAQWRDHVLAARTIADSTDRYTEARFEELSSDGGPELLQRLFSFCEIEATSAECREIVSANPSSLLWSGEVARRLGRAPDEPEGFSGEGGVGAWREELGARDRIAFERQAGDLLSELGYATPGWTGVTPLRRRATIARLAAARQVGRARYFAGRLADGR